METASGSEPTNTEAITPDAEERQWLMQIANKDRTALKLLYDRYAARVFRFIVRMLNDEARAQELVNDVMLEIWKSAERFEGRSAVSSWILGIARFRTLNALRGHKPEIQGLEQSPEPVDPTADSSHIKGREQLQALLRQALQRLSPEHREVVELTFFHGCSYSEIAAIVDCPENTVKTRMYHARNRLRPILERLGITALDAGEMP
ncbi:MAG: sigma-70 family RNA polymerase sigma factor [Marinobacterium sp.]|nr:sigma-70 family RNA polymerase sigma factor [Marinobacterium sp.]